MSITNNTIVAKTAAVVAGLGLVAMSFASFAPAQAQSTSDLQAQINSLLATIASLQAQLGGSASMSASVTFTRDLTIGATGSDVTALQTWLIGKGFSIPAGATGYFGAQTQAALAAYQAANGITPAAGYFGPITRAKVNASAGTSTGTGTGTGTGTSTTLKGGEADLTNYNLTTGDTLTEGDTNTEIASAKFDVNGGDVNVSRVKVEVQGAVTSGSPAPSANPWLYFDKISVYDGSTKVGSVDAGSRSDWDSNDSDSSMNSSGLNDYTIDVPVSDVVKDGDTAELSVRADAQSTIDSDNNNQTFTLRIPDNGIRAVDAAGIQEYSGSNSDKVTVDFNGNSSGKLTVSEDSSDPDAGVLVADDNQSTNDLTVFAFKVKNTQDSDSLLDSVKLTVGTSTGTSAHNITDIIRKATLTLDGKDYDGTVNTNNTISFDLSNDNVVVSGNDSVVGTVKIDLASQSGHYSATGESLTFSIAASSDVKAEGVTSGNSTTVSGTANGNKQSIALNGGISVAGNDMSTNLTYNSNSPASSYGTFTLKFDVTAVGDDVYVPKTLEAGASTTSWGANTGVTVITDLNASTTSSTVSSSLTTTADSDNSNYYVIHAGDTETFTATVTIDPTATGDYQVGVNSIRFNTDDSSFTGLQTLDVDQTDSQFHTDPLHIPNS